MPKSQGVRWSILDLPPAMVDKWIKDGVALDGTVDERVAGGEQKQNKYRAKATEVDGMRFHSMKEAAYYEQLKMRRAAGDLWFLRQVPFHLPGKIVYRVDFVEFHKDGSVHFVDVKGFENTVSKNKIKQTEALYPVKIELA